MNGLVRFRKSFGKAPLLIGAVVLCVMGAGILSLPKVTHALQIDKTGSNEVFNDFVVGPGKVELTLNPGQKMIVPIHITNRTGRKTTYSVTTEDFAGSTDPRQTVVLLGDSHGPYTLKDYLHPEVSNVTLENEEKATINIEVTVPVDSEPGGRYGTVLLSTVSANGESIPASGVSGSAAIVTRVGVLFFITVPGAVHHDGQLKTFSIKEGTVQYNEGPLTFDLLYENKGSIHLNPYGRITVRNILGQVVGESDLDPWFAMPSSVRLREVTWTNTMLFGRYTATAEINRGYDDIIDTAKVTFWVIPWIIVAGVVLVIFILLIVLRWIKKNFTIRRKA